MFGLRIMKGKKIGDNCNIFSLFGKLKIKGENNGGLILNPFPSQNLRYPELEYCGESINIQIKGRDMAIRGIKLFFTSLPLSFNHFPSLPLLIPKYTIRAQLGGWLGSRIRQIELVQAS